MAMTVKEARIRLQEIEEEGKGDDKIYLFAEYGNDPRGEEVEDIAVLEHKGKPYVSVI